MAIELRNCNRGYRDYLPFGHYDLIIISLVHQPSEMIYYMANNLSKYVKGNFLWIVHYNNSEYIDENMLPSWVWLVRETIKTERSTRLLLLAINQALKFAFINVTSTNIMTLSSGSAFFREFIVPKKSKVALKQYKEKLEPGNHMDEIDIKHLGYCGMYLKSIGSMSWQYGWGGDSDIEFSKLIVKRGFKYLKGCQWSGQIWPYEVGKMLVEDLSEIEGSEYNSRLKYAAEEIYLSTYAYNYAIKNKLNLDFVEVIIEWNEKYNITDIRYIDYLRSSLYEGSCVCKVSDNLSDPVRVYLCKV
jgi:hypothetical protein